MSVQACNGSGTRKFPTSFNTSYVSVQDISDWNSRRTRFVSIHPMCRFKLNQYLLPSFLHCFNTSYVSVQGYTAPLWQSSPHVSIHPMCRFKDVDGVDIAIDECFNTSYVSVQV